MEYGRNDMPQSRNRILIVLGLVAFGMAMRVLPYVLQRFGLVSLTDPSTFIWNVSPVPAICMLFGAYLSSRGTRWTGLAIGIVAYFASDLLIALVTGYPEYAFYKTLPFVYAGFMIHGLMGLTLHGRSQPVRLGLTVVASELVFWLITNFGEWAIGDQGYAKTPAGMLTCYVAAIPYLYRSIYGTLIYSAILFEAARIAARQANDSNLVLAPVPTENRP